MINKPEASEVIFRDVCKDFEADLRQFNGESDHLHVLVISPPKLRLSELVNSVRGVSRDRLKTEFPAIPTFWNVRTSEGPLRAPSLFCGLRCRRSNLRPQSVN